MGLLGSLGSLNVLLSADTAQFSSAMDKAAYTAERDLQRISSKAKFNAAIISAALVAAATAIAVSVKKTIDHADQIGKMAQSLGMTVEQLSSLEYAAKLSNIEVEGLRTAFQRFNKTIYDESNGILQNNISAFKALGISIRDNSGNVKSNYELFLESADALSKMNDSVQKSAIAQILWGKSGAALIPLLNSGKEGIQKLTDEARRLGIILDSETVAASERFNDNMTRMSQVVQGIKTSFTAGLIPTMAKLSDDINSSTTALNLFNLAGKSVAYVGITIANIFTVASQAADTLVQSIGALSGELSLLIQGKFKEAWDTLVAYNTGAGQGWIDVMDKIQERFDVLSGKVASSTTDMKQNINTTSDSLEGFQKKTNSISKAAKDLGMTFQSAFEDAIIEGKELSEVFDSLLKDIERIILRYAITIPLANAISSFFPGSTTASAHGNIFSGGRLLAFASGGLITRPTIFPMANGGMGLAGEAGTEAIMPLFRTGSGDLGVKSASRGVEINIYAPEGSSVRQDSQITGDKEQINIMIDDAVAGQVGNSGSKTYKALKKSFGLRQVLNTR